MNESSAAARTIAGRKTEPGFEWGALRALVPYLWPHGIPSIKLRVVIALILLAAAKLANVYVPFLYKAMVDLFSEPTRAAVELPIALLLG